MFQCATVRVWRHRVPLSDGIRMALMSRIWTINQMKSSVWNGYSDPPRTNKDWHVTPRFAVTFARYPCKYIRFVYQYVDCDVLYIYIKINILIFIYLSIYLSIDRSIYLPIYLSINLSIDLSIYLSILSINQSINQPIYLSIHPSTYLSIYLPTYLSIYLSVCLSVLSFLSFLSIYLSIDRSIDLSIHPSTHMYIYIYVYVCVYIYIYMCVCVRDIYISLPMASLSPDSFRSLGVDELLLHDDPTRDGGPHHCLKPRRGSCL